MTGNPLSTTRIISASVCYGVQFHSIHFQLLMSSTCDGIAFDRGILYVEFNLISLFFIIYFILLTCDGIDFDRGILYV